MQKFRIGTCHLDKLIMIGRIGEVGVAIGSRNPSGHKPTAHFEAAILECRGKTLCRAIGRLRSMPVARSKCDFDAVEPSLARRIKNPLPESRRIPSATCEEIPESVHTACLTPKGGIIERDQVGGKLDIPLFDHVR